LGSGHEHTGLYVLLPYTARRWQQLATDTTTEPNRRALIEELRRWSGREIIEEDYATWRAVFRSLADLAADEPYAPMPSLGTCRVTWTPSTTHVPSQSLHTDLQQDLAALF
jgi:hypothetical protein